MKAEWILDYDMHTDRCYRRPGCPKCQAPVGPDGKCYSCREEYELDDDMRRWWHDNESEKVGYEDCYNKGCHGMETLEIHYRRNPVSGEWLAAYGRCSKCGMRFIV